MGTDTRTDEPPAIARPPVIVDCDPGHDDVVAIVVAASTCELLGITTVAGNAPLERCTRNALATVELFGLDVAVHSGADRPLVRPGRHDVSVHGDDGLVGVQVPDPSAQASAGTAVQRLVQASQEVDGLWLVATGPLTNVALALRADPGMAGRLAGITLMGGAVASGNVTPAAEFNFWFDPEAAAVVFESGVPLRMCGLDVTRRVLVGHDHARRLRDAGDPAATFVADVFDGYARSCERLHGVAEGPMHDPCAVAALVRPDLFRFEHLHVAVEARGRLTAGMSVADRRPVARGGAGDPNTHVALDVDAEGMLELVQASVVAAARR